MDEDKKDEGKAPYLPFQTFVNYLTELATKPLPPKIDRTMMKTKSGSDQANLTAALKFFGYIDPDQHVTESLRSFVQLDDEGRKAALAGQLRNLYPDAYKVSDERGSEKALEDSFAHAFGYSGETRRKAMTFFLHASRWCGVTLSAHFPTTRMGSGRSATAGSKRTSPKKSTVAKKSAHRPTSTQKPVSGEVVEVAFGAVGTAVLSINAPLLSLPADTLTRLLKVVSDFRALGFEEAEEDELYMPEAEYDLEDDA